MDLKNKQLLVYKYLLDSNLDNEFSIMRFLNEKFIIKGYLEINNKTLDEHFISICMKQDTNDCNINIGICNIVDNNKDSEELTLLRLVNSINEFRLERDTLVLLDKSFAEGYRSLLYRTTFYNYDFNNLDSLFKFIDEKITIIHDEVLLKLQKTFEISKYGNLEE